MLQFHELLIEEWSEHQQRRLDGFPRQGKDDAFVSLELIQGECAPPDICAAALRIIARFEKYEDQDALSLDSAPIKSLIPTQGAVDPKKVASIGKKYDEITKPLWIMKYGTKLYVVDGHHRLAAAVLLGQTHITCSILTYSDAIDAP